MSTVKTKLEGKITSDVDLPQVYFSRVINLPKVMAMSHSVPWWLRREYLRTEHGVYPGNTEIVEKLNALNGSFALHIAKDDQTMIAYTPDAAMGEADRQVRTTLGKFLSKYYPFLPETLAKDMVDEHMSELLATYEVLRGPDITVAYKSGETGACMSKSASEWTKLNGHHPTEAYHTDKIGMAVLRNKRGEISARCMIVDQSPTDKRWIRIYGGDGPKLEKLLKRAGYVRGTWHDVEFNQVPLTHLCGDDGELAFALPYLDGNGGAGSTAVSSVAYVEGVLKGIKDKHYSAYKRIDARMASVHAATCGYVLLKPVITGTFTRYCGLTGKAYSMLEHTPVPYWDGEETLQVLEESLPNGVNYITGSTSTSAFYAPASLATFNVGGRMWLDNEGNREYNNFARLDSEFYPEDREWYHIYRLVEVGNKKYIRPDDSLEVFDGSRKVFIHKQALTKDYIKTHGDKYVHKSSEIVKTVSGRKVVMGFHEVHKTWDGKIDFNRNLVEVHYMGRYYYVQRSERSQVMSSPAFMEMGVEAAILRSADAYDSYDLETAALRICAEYISGSIYVNNRWIRTQDAELPLAEVFDILATTVASRPDHLAKLACIRAYVYWRKAEAEAVDYNLPFDAQGSAYGLFVPPPEVPDEEGLVSAQRRYLTKLWSGGSRFEGLVDMIAQADNQPAMATTIANRMLVAAAVPESLRPEMITAMVQRFAAMVKLAPVAHKPVRYFYSATSAITTVTPQSILTINSIA